MQATFDSYEVVQIDGMPAVETHMVAEGEPPQRLPIVADV